MIDSPFVFIAGILGSAHCVGMCGGFALTLGTHAPSWRGNLGRQGVYSLGRLFTYGVLGAAAGFAGERAAHSAPALIHASAWLSLLAGALLIWQGLETLGWGPSLWWRGRSRKLALHGPPPCISTPFLATFLRSERIGDSFLAGLFTGLLPCGLLYGMLALAASRQHFGEGMLVMTLFGLGTVPVMLVTGLGASALGIPMRRKLFAAAAVCLLITGVIATARGVGFLAAPEPNATESCPFCVE